MYYHPLELKKKWVGGREAVKDEGCLKKARNRSTSWKKRGKGVRTEEFLKPDYIGTDRMAGSNNFLRLWRRTRHKTR